MRRFVFFPLLALALLFTQACQTEEPPIEEAIAVEDTVTVGEGLAMGEDFSLDSASTAQMSVVQVLRAANFGILVDVLSQAGLIETLEGAGPFTVFAPTGAAFDALPEGQLDALLQPENREQLRSLLLYHVVPANLSSSALNATGRQENSVQGSALRLVAREDGAFVNNAEIIRADIPAANGMIHVISEVLMPPAGGQ